MASLLAGVSIGIACILYIMAPNPIIGAILFSLGLLNIRSMGFKLVTGNMQKLITDDDCSILGLLKMFFLNGLGVLAVVCIGLWIPQVKYGAMLIANNKLMTPLLEIFARAIVCGYLMTIATRPSTPLWMTSLCVFAFVSTGMCHCVADVFYYSILSGPSACLPHLGITIAGNTVGAIEAALTPSLPRSSDTR